MAEEWINMRRDLASDPAVIAIGTATPVGEAESGEGAAMTVYRPALYLVILATIPWLAMMAILVVMVISAPGCGTQSGYSAQVASAPGFRTRSRDYITYDGADGACGYHLSWSYPPLTAWATPPAVTAAWIDPSR